MSDEESGMLREFLEKALELGAEGLEICYKDRQRGSLLCAIQSASGLTQC